MLSSADKMISPSRTYVVICNRANFDGVYFRKFMLPDSFHKIPWHAQDYASCEGIKDKNNASFAMWYFLNVLDHFACVEGCITFEDYCQLREINTVGHHGQVVLTICSVHVKSIETEPAS